MFSLPVLSAEYLPGMFRTQAACGCRSPYDCLMGQYRKTVPQAPSYRVIRGRLRGIADPMVARASQRFFKTGPGEYGAGDRFLGIRVPQLRKLVPEFQQAPRSCVIALLESTWHEERLLALMLLVRQYELGDQATRSRIARLYLARRQYVNNWDLVDSSAHLILGPHLQDVDRRLLYRLARSRNLWDRRIAMLATLCYIRQKDHVDALRIAKLLIGDGEDLIHKAVGWMLREIGNRAAEVERKFLDEYAAQMPRTMLRYAIEKFPARERARYMKEKSR
jgi:3-methyladenine DNA glycosylase AlkD